jgi:hypothetical protein
VKANDASSFSTDLDKWKSDLEIGEKVRNDKKVMIERRSNLHLMFTIVGLRISPDQGWDRDKRALLWEDDIKEFEIDFEQRSKDESKIREDSLPTSQVGRISFAIPAI